MNGERFITILEAANRLGKSRPTVYKLIKDRKLKAERIVGRPAIAIKEIERFLALDCKPMFGSARGKVKMSPDFDDSMV